MESTATTTVGASDTAITSISSTMTSRTSPIVDTGQSFCSVSQMSPIKGQAINFTIKSPPNETLVSTSAKSSKSRAKSAIDTESVSSSLSDVENFTGKIVYNPDGSAYIIEGPESEGSDVEAEVSQEGSIIDARGMTPPYGRSNVVFPQVVSAFHISRSSAAALYSALYGQAYQNILQENKVPEVPVMHSYRVFNLRDNFKTNCDEQTSATDLSGGNSLIDKDNNNTIRSNAINYSESSAANSASSCQTVPVKPILMCFICKLSFGYSKSFIAHSIQEHNIALNDEEKRVLSNKNSSAIIQGVGKDKEPLLSFLEPKQRMPTLNDMPVQFQQQLEAQQRLLASVAAAAALRQSSCSSSLTTSADHKISAAISGCNTAAKTAMSGAGTFVSSVTTSPVTSTVDIKQCESQSHSSALSFVLPKNGDDRHFDHSDTTPTSRETPEADTSSFGPELADLANLEKIAKAAAAAAQQQQIEQNSQMAATHQSLPQRSPSPSKQFIQSAPSPKSPIASTTPSLSQYHSSPSPTNASPFMCSAHPDGKTNGVECPKCDLILGSSRSLGGHMTMMHSRNSCKTLKCPKCNWHYKYQETLEIHMKEKHPENEMNCIYCLANQPHPRLARGETYTCGYKPYRCEVCNYSTTTKGNLSIHMQSDKHINNVQELQNGNIPAEHLLQSQALAAAVAASATGVQSTTSSVPTTTTSASSITTSPAVTAPVTAPTKAQQVVQSSGAQPSAPSKQKATWRCDVCNYETNVARNLRIHMTSEKHTHNLMVLKQNVSHMQQLSALQQGIITPEQLFQFHPGIFAAAAGLATGQPGGPADNLQPEAALADMAYNHALLMMASQQQQQRAMAAAMIQQQQQQSQSGTPGNKSPVARMSGTGAQPTYDIEHPDPSLGLHNVPYDDTCRLFQCCVCGIYSSDSIEGLSQHIQCDRTRQREDEVLMAVGGSYICKLCSYKTNLKANFQLHCKTDKHLQRLQHVNHIKEGGTQSEWKLKYVNVSNPVQVRCNVCDYYTNSIHKLQLHTANAQHDACSRVFLHLQLAETLVNGSPNKYYYCALCAHPSRTKISLVQHIHSMKHIRNNSLRQMKQQQSGSLGMKDSEEEIRELFQVKELSPNDKIVFENDNNSNDEISDSPPLGAMESANDSMLKNALMEQHAVAQMAAKLNCESSSGEMHFCPYCNYSHTSEVRIQMHIVSTHSKQRSNSTTPPTTNIVTNTEQTMLCPLCQEGFKEKSRLETHLIDIHNVKQEGLQKLMLLVDTTEVINSKAVRHNSPNWSQNEDSLDSKSEQREMDAKSDCSGDSGSKLCEDEIFDTNALSESLQCPGCPKIFLSLDELFTHINSEGHLKLTEISGSTRTGTLGNANSGYQCWKRGCGQIFKTINATQLHFKEQHSIKSGKISGAAVSDRHVYKYRCSQCSLAFKTIEKLQLHSQYHLIRAATQCVLCGRSFRSVEALQKHVESTHSEMSEEELEQYKSSLVNNPLLFSGRNGGGILDPSTTELLKKESNRLDDINNEDEAMDLVLTNSANLPEDTDEDMTDLNDNRDGMVAPNQQTNSLEDFLNSQAVAEDSYNDPNRKYKCHRCRVAFTRQSYLTSHNKTLLHRKGEKLSYPMEKYLDPNRPYKCDICKESFTQKNILLVHYNSVSHLHKLKQTMKENNQTSNQSSNTSVSAINTNTQNTSPNIEASNQSSVQSSNACNASDLEKKPYRCNICKVAYNLGTTLDIHVRSVLHQTRASKLHDLALTGQIDLSVPLIERPDNTSETAVTATTPSTPNSSIPNATVTTSPPKMADPNKPGTPSPSTTPKFQETLMSLNLSDPQQVQQAAALQQAALNLAMSAGNNGHNLLLSSSPFQCQRCGSAFISSEAQLQHQQLCCLFSPPNNGANIKQSAINQQRSQSPQTNDQQSAQTTQSTPQSIRTPKFSSYAPVCRSKPPLYKHLLETWGFEIVMQFNECHQKRVKKEVNPTTDVKKESDINPNSSEMKDNTSGVPNEPKPEIKESEPKKDDMKSNLPEINRSKCEKCSKEFSSIWVLKAHKEEIHRDVVPLDVVELFADDYRTEYERKCALEEENDASTDQMTSNTNEGSQMAAGPNISGPSNTPPLSMTNNLGNSSASVSQADMAAANQMAAHLQFSQLLMSMGLAGMGMNMNMPLGMNMNAMNMPFAAAAAMGLHPPLIPVMMAPHIDPMMAAAFNHPGAAAMVGTPTQSTASAPSPMPTNDPNFFATQQKIIQQQQQQQLNAAQQQKRARTRISDEQLKVLRQYFDINNSPTEEQLLEMSEKSGLPMKVIKHWFRNTLFKERQRNKDSPYNFNNPPSTFLNLEEYEKTGETKVLTLNDIKKENDTKDIAIESTNNAPDLKSSSSTKDTDYATSDDEAMNEAKKKDLNTQKTEQQIQEKFENHFLQLQKQQQQQIQQQIQLQQQEFELTKAMLNANANSPHTSESSMSSQSAAENSAASLFAGLPGFASSLAPPLGSGPLQMAIDAAHRSQMGNNSNNPNRSEGNGNSNSGSQSGKRANRTRFTDYQIKVLQEFFESNAYPKDDDLEYLSKLLNLSPRVIVVWFQNARQKARKVYENQPPVPQEDDGSGRFQRTPGLNYQCKKCMQVFQRYYELIKHQKSACFKDENPLAAQIRAAAESRAQSTSPGVSREAPSTTPTPVDSGRTSATPDKIAQQSPQPTPTSQSQSSQSSQQSVYRCDKCSLVFNRYDLWREHQLVHLMNPNLFPNYPPSSPFGILQYEAQQQTSPQTNASTSPNIVNTLSASLQLSSQPLKRKLPEDEDLDSHDFDSMSGGVGAANEQPRDKRLRTTILPEQLDYLYQKYQIESNPSRKMLESIAKEVGLKKRVVQVWFQNTRARERKGQFRAHQQVIHKRCPFCRALFKARSALESHLATRHADQYTKGDINIDALPDGDPSDMNDSSPPNTNEDIMRNANVSGLTAEALQSTMKKYYEDSLKKYLEELNLPGKDGMDSIPSDLSLKMKAAFEASGLTGESAPLDLSKPVDLSQPLRFSANDDEGFDDTRSDGEDSDSSDDLEFDYYYSHESNPTSPAPGSTTSSTASAMNRNLGSGPNTPSNSSKRFRTQMTTVMLKVMKSIFADYKTPSMAECECLGREIGLPKRVVQVWFQNARAKEKKAKLAFAKTFGQELETNTKPIEECKICGIKYNLKFSSTSMQDHLFSKKHIENLKLHIDSVKKLIEGQEDNSADFPIASGIVLPVIPTTGQNNTNNASEANDSRSTSATNLMQQLQLMGLTGALSSGLPLPDVTVNGTNTKNESMSTKSSPEKTVKTNSVTNNKDSNSSASSGGVNNASEGTDNSALFNYMYPGLQNYYTNANAGAAAAFLHPSMYGTAANSTVPSGSNGSNTAGPNTNPTASPTSSGPLQPQESLQNFAQTAQPQQQIAQQSTTSAQMSGHNTSASFYADTSNMYGTPLSLLQLPPSILPEITNKLNQMGVSSVRFMQDGRNIEELRPVISEYDFKMISESDVEVGFTCKKCHMTYPAEVLCLGHQRASCFAKQNSDIKATLKLVQIYIECRVCREKFGSIFEYKFHCDCDRHRKRTQKLEMSNTTTNTPSNTITTNGQTIASNDITTNSLADMSGLFINGNDANLLNYLTKNLNNSGVAYSNISDANH